ncbi:hypothetical protein TNCV_1227691 [Trichonephila clavipes]|nr:hypothetical protein TNCV_1227691 [Trichonephila clavipes]
MERFSSPTGERDTIFNRQDSWRHCAGKDNPSRSFLTRGISADSLINCEKWWKGPKFPTEGNTVPVSSNVLLSDESAYLEGIKTY